MNRAERRRIPPAIRGIADTLHTVKCPDCNNDARLVHDDEIGMWWIQILHNDTCPWLTRYEERNQ